MGIFHDSLRPPQGRIEKLELHEREKLIEDLVEPNMALFWPRSEGQEDIISADKLIECVAGFGRGESPGNFI